VNDAALVNVLYTLNELFENILSLGLRQLVHSKMLEVAKKITTFHILGHDVGISLYSEHFNKR